MKLSMNLPSLGKMINLGYFVVFAFLSLYLGRKCHFFYIFRLKNWVLHTFEKTKIHVFWLKRSIFSVCQLFCQNFVDAQEGTKMHVLVFFFSQEVHVFFVFFWPKSVDLVNHLFNLIHVFSAA